MVISGLTCLQVEALHTRANTLVANFQGGNGTTDSIDEAILLDREALEFCPPGHPLRVDASDQLAHHLHTRYKCLGAIADIDEAIALTQEALQSCTPAHPDRGDLLKAVSTYLAFRYGELGRMEDLDEAIVLGQEALSLCPPGHPSRSSYLITLAQSLFDRFQQLDRMECLDEAIVLVREALDLSPPGHPSRFIACNDLSLCLAHRYSQLLLISDLDQAIILSREALQLCPPGHPDRCITLENLSHRLSDRYQQTSTGEDLDEAIDLTREALDLSPPGHPHRSESLDNLSQHLGELDIQLGTWEHLEECIFLAQAALDLRPPGHPHRLTPLGTLAKHLSRKYAWLKDVECLNQAISLGRETLALEPPGHLYRTLTLSNLAHRLCTRYKQLGATEDLDEAALLDREALECTPPGNPDREMALFSITVRLCLQYEQVGEIAYLDQAIVLGQDLLALSPPGNPYRDTSLENLAAALLKRHTHRGEMEDCDEAIVLYREALALRIPGEVTRPLSLISLADGLFSRYEKLGHIEDLDEAIVLGRDAVSLLLPNQQHRSSYIKPLAAFLFVRFARSGQPNDREGMFDLYSQLADIPQGISSWDLSAAIEWVRAAEQFQHPTTLLAYDTSLRFLVQHVTILPSLRHQLHFLQKLTLPLGVDGFSAGLRHGSPTKAVEFLEQGHGVFWGHLARLRSPLDDVMASGSAALELAGRFKELTSQICHHAVTLDAADGDQRDSAFQRNIEWHKVVQKIRALPGLSRFLSPSPFVDLQQAARDGPVIVVNASQYGCDALVILLDRDPVHIPLQITQARVRDLSRELDSWLALPRSADVTRGLASVLSQLWDDVVSPIVNFLRTIHPYQSRIWWCPTAEFSFLPLHAAGPYRCGEQNVADLYVSSYTPTLAALIRARRPSTSTPTRDQKRFLAVGHANGVGIDLDSIGQRVHGHATWTRIDGDAGTLSRVSDALSKSQWVHLACDVLPDDDQPWNTAFVLPNGRRLTLQHLIQECAPEDPQCAYLASGPTAIGDRQMPNEAVHLASAMMCAGFRSVVGTMTRRRGVDDADAGRQIAPLFYDRVLEAGCLDGSRAALALHETMNRWVDVPLDQRIVYVHFGV